MPAFPAASGSSEADARAADAERSVGVLFGGRLLGMPFTHLARAAHPAPPFVGGSWNYWWQAHYLDAIVDAGFRRLRSGDREGARQRARLGHRLLTTIKVRNIGRFTNLFYDDMAWLVLAVDRLRLLQEALDDLSGDGLSRRVARRLERADHALTAQLRSAMTDDLGGGLFWNTTRDFKNVPATGPTALHLARRGDLAAAHELVDWVCARLHAADTGLFLDGIRVTPAGEQVVTDVYTYNQGTMLGALVTLGDDTSLARARAIVRAVPTQLTAPCRDRHPLVTHGGGDGGLFTGILVRYLALAASHDKIGDETRSTATRLVLDTAECFWLGRDDRTLSDGRWACVFSPDAVRPAGETQPTGEPVELSTQLQAWMTLEAAAALG